jgi:hypothetical protein
MHRDPGHLAVHQLALARVQAGAHLQSQLRHGLDDRVRTADGPRRPVEGREEAVSGCVHLRSAEADELAADELVVALEEVAPGAVAERGRLLAGADDVGEEHRGEHAVRLGLVPPGFPSLDQELLDRTQVRLRVAGERRVVGARKLDVPRALDETRRAPTSLA